MKKIRVLIWNEFYHEQHDEAVKKLYPLGMHSTIGSYLQDTGRFEVTTAVLNDFEHGLTEERLRETDVLIWWSHVRHKEVSDVVVDRVHKRVTEGMGFIALHSSHASKIFSKLCGTDTVNLKWREDGKKEILWVIDHAHPIVEGLEKDHIVLNQEEMYGERFDIPTPDELIFISWFEGGEVCRSGVTYKRGRGKIFYFRPGHEGYPTFYNPEIMKVIANAANWCAPQSMLPPKYGMYEGIAKDV